MQDQERSWARRPYERSNRPHERDNDRRQPTSRSGSNGARSGEESRQWRSPVSGGYKRGNYWRAPASHSGSNSTGSSEERRRRRSPVSWDDKRSRSPSPLISPSHAENSESRRDSRLQNPPPSRGVPATPQPREVVAGIIMNFPAHFQRSRSEKLRDQPWVNGHATGHPVLVWDTYSKDAVQYARCLPMTSFKTETIEEKYPDAWRHHVRYVPISHGRETTKSRTKMPTLTLAENGKMDKQTYVHLDHFFDIEVAHLQPRYRDAGSMVPLQLDNDSLNVLVFKLGQFIRGEIWRPAPNRWITSPLDWHQKKWSLQDPELGTPQFSSELEGRALLGGELEAVRHKKAGTREWTGHEKESPRKGAWEPVEAAATPVRPRTGDTWGQLQPSLARYAS